MMKTSKVNVSVIFKKYNITFPLSKHFFAITLHKESLEDFSLVIVI